jgi:hypothetical protein
MKLSSNNISPELAKKIWEKYSPPKPPPKPPRTPRVVKGGKGK